MSPVESSVNLRVVCSFVKTVSLPFWKPHLCGRLSLFLGSALLAFFSVFPRCASAGVYQGVAANYQWSLIQSESDQTFSLYSPGLQYCIYAGKKAGFFGRVGMLYPSRLHQDGTPHRTRDYYSTSLGVDSLAGVGIDLPVKNDVHSILGLGAHLNWVKMSGEGYTSFYNVTMGVGVEGLLNRRIAKYLEIGCMVSAGWDFADLIHEQNDLRFGFFAIVGVTLGFTLT